jgi:hypothetical protein
VAGAPGLAYETWETTNLNGPVPYSLFPIPCSMYFSVLPAVACSNPRQRPAHSRPRPAPPSSFHPPASSKQ